MGGGLRDRSSRPLLPHPGTPGSWTFSCDYSQPSERPAPRHRAWTRYPQRRGPLALRESARDCEPAPALRSVADRSVGLGSADRSKANRMTDRYLENSALSYRDAAKRSSAMLPTKGSPWL